LLRRRRRRRRRRRAEKAVGRARAPRAHARTTAQRVGIGGGALLMLSGRPADAEKTV